MPFNIDVFKSHVREACEFLQKEIDPFPRLGLVIGSGLGGFLGKINREKEIAFSAIPHFPVSTVAGHSGKLVLGSVNETPLIVLSGRKHFYEGVSSREVTFPVRVLGRLGLKILILTNAAGGLNPHFSPGDLMLISDHVNFQFRNPLIGPNVVKWGPRFPDMSEPYDSGLRRLARSVALKEKIPLREGVYLAGLGPSYETRAEVRFLRLAGADAVGMSTIPENIVARQMGIRVLGVTFISNSLVLDPNKETTHEEVLANVKLVEGKFEKLMMGIIERIKIEMTGKNA